MPLYGKLATAVDAMARCQKTGNDWAAVWENRIATAVREHMPSGSGFDNGTTLDVDASSAEKLIFRTSFHHMNEGGMYDGWTDHNVTVRPSLVHGFTLSISGRDRNAIKDYIAESFSVSLAAPFDWED